MTVLLFYSKLIFFCFFYFMLKKELTSQEKFKVDCVRKLILNFIETKLEINYFIVIYLYLEKMRENFKIFDSINVNELYFFILIK